MSDAFNMDFIIVGAMKSGTTSLIHHLGRHPRICIPKSEVHFFENDANYRKGLGWYEGRIRRHQTEVTTVFGEKTTAYSFHEDAPARIRAAFPRARLVWIFREPVARAYSNYIHAYRMGAVRGSFEEAVEKEAERMKENRYSGYMARSRYALQVKRYLEHFGKAQMHFMVFEHFIHHVKEELDSLFDFIGVTSEGFELKDEPRGRAVMPRWPSSIYHARRLFGPGLLHRAVLFANTMFQKPGYDKLDPAYKAELKTRFTEENAELAELTGLELSAWA